MFYVFDTLPIVLCLTTYIFFHPGYLLPEPETQPALGAADLEGGKQQLGKGQETESAGSGSGAFQVQVLQV